MSAFPIILSTIVISLTVIFSSLVNITYGQVNDTSQTYENRDIGIKFLFPSDWGKVVEARAGCHTEPSCVLALEGTNTTYQFGFVLIKFSKERCDCKSLTDFVKNMYKTVEQKKGFSFINDNQTIVNKKYPGWQVEYSFLNEDKVNAKGFSVGTTNNESYIAMDISYPVESQAKLLPQFKNVINSIEFLPMQVAKTPSFMSKNETEEFKPDTNLREESIGNNLNGLQILSHNSFTDSLGYMHVVGEIKNNYPSTATFVRIVGTFYDINNQVVGTQFTYSTPSDIGSGDRAPFELVLTSASVPIAQIDHYNLQTSYQ
ncbi:MAG TPA: FxLYD domain-containing protein [Nitrososphaeraceae archaeon]|nr:FxLYD domain-containing protein [Nitrososphaeraceae archaeon]